MRISSITRSIMQAIGERHGLATICTRGTERNLDLIEGKPGSLGLCITASLLVISKSPTIRFLLRVNKTSLPSSCVLCTVYFHFQLSEHEGVGVVL